MDFDNIFIKLRTLSHKFSVLEYKRLVHVKSNGNDVFGILPSQSLTLVQFQVFEEELFIVSQLNYQGNIEHVLEPLGEDERDQVSHVHRVGARPPASVQEELLPRGVHVQDGVQLPVGEEDAATEHVVRLVTRHLLKLGENIRVNLGASKLDNQLVVVNPLIGGGIHVPWRHLVIITGLLLPRLAVTRLVLTQPRLEGLVLQCEPGHIITPGP